MIERLFFLDNLKIALIFLVIIHHVGQAYGPTGGFWPFVSSQPDSLSWLGRFFGVNATFFMGLFFMISGYFFAPSYDKKGFYKYSLDKVIRLGIPLVFVYMIMMPCVFYFYYINYSNNPDISYWIYFKTIFLGLGAQPSWFQPSIGWPESNFGFGHLWFVEHLLIYSLIYALFRLFYKAANRNYKLNSYFIVLFLIAIISISSIIVRNYYPIDKWIDILGFITSEIAHLPQYTALLITGIVAYKTDLFKLFPSRFGMLLLYIGLIMAIVIYISPYVPEIINTIIWKYFEIYETIMCVSLCFGLITFFRNNINSSNLLLKAFADNSYGAYIFHFPIVIAIQYAFDKISIPILSKFVIVSMVSIIMSYGVSFMIRNIRILRKVI